MRQITEIQLVSDKPDKINLFPVVAIITINFNQAQMTIECINSILASDYNSYEIALIDNGSKIEDYNELLKTFENYNRVLVYRIEKNCGYVGGVNFGIEKARKTNPEYIMIMNNDTIIDKHAITELVKTADKYEQNAIVSGKVYHFDRPDVLQQTGMIFFDHRYLQGTYPGRDELDTGQYDQEAERDSLDDIFWLLPVKIIDDVGLYCNYFFLYAEQGDFAQRAKCKGYKLIYTPKSKIWHKGSITSGGGNKKALPVCYWRGKATFIFQYRNLKKKYFLVLAIKSLLKYLVKLIILKGEERNITKAMFSGYLAGLRWVLNKKPDTGYNPYLK